MVGNQESACEASNPVLSERLHGESARSQQTKQRYTLSQKPSPVPKTGPRSVSTEIPTHSKLSHQSIALRGIGAQFRSANPAHHPDVRNDPPYNIWLADMDLDLDHEEREYLLLGIGNQFHAIDNTCASAIGEIDER